MTTKHPYEHLIKELPGLGKYYSLTALEDKRLDELPYCIRILLEGGIRCCDGFETLKSHVEDILDWKTTSKKSTEIPFKPSRVLLQDFTGVPAAVDLAAMRDAMKSLNADPQLINPLVPVDLVIDHSVQVDKSRNPEALHENQEIEFQRNKERFAFLKWGASAFQNMLIVPPGSGIVHQVNLEYLARVVFEKDGYLYPDSVVGTDSHTTMIDGLGVTAWGVGGIEAEAVMLGQPISMVLPEVVGFELVGLLPEGTTATDLVLTVTRMLRERGVVGKFVEFFGDGCKRLKVADRATISNMSPEYGATMGYFPVDAETVDYLRLTGRDEATIHRIETYFKAQRLFRLYDECDKKIQYSGPCLRLDLSTLAACVAGPKRPHDHILLKELKSDFKKCLTAPIGFKGYGLSSKSEKVTAQFQYRGKTYMFSHGTVVIAAITSCTNTSNPLVMLGAGLIAKKAVELGLSVKPFIKTSLSPGSKTVIDYLQISKCLPYLETLGFYTTGFGCQTCIGNSGELDPEVSEVITKHDFVATAVLSGNRNFEGRVHPLTRANYLMSPMLVVLFALAGTVDIDLFSEPVGYTSSHTPVYMKDLWPDDSTLRGIVDQTVLPSFFKEAYANIKQGGTDSWKKLQVPASTLYPWSKDSTYIHDPPFFKSMTAEPPQVQDIEKAYCLLYLGDSVTTDHISPAGSIAKTSPAAIYLRGRGIKVENFNTYGSRRGNDEIMVRGTFANIRIINKLVPTPGPFTKFIPTGEELPIFDVSMKYRECGKSLIVIAGKEYGSGSSRDWAAKGPYLLGIRAVFAESYERIHRSNLIGMGVLPLQFIPGQTPTSLHLDGTEMFSIGLRGIKKPSEIIQVIVHRPNGQQDTISMLSRVDTAVELEYFYHGGILQYVLRKLLKASR